jgi:enoyl-CoA hydratase/carnithine racemase
LAAAYELASEIASKSPDAVRGAKRLLEQAWNRPAADGLALEAEIQRKLIGSPNQLAAVTAGLGQRSAQFIDPD